MARSLSVQILLLTLLPTLLLAGCQALRPLAAIEPGRDGGKLANPLFVPAMDRETLWNTTVDVVDDYFKIEHEERVRLIGGVLTEGRIDTIAQTGSTLFEPWRYDSTPGYEKLHATLQSIRRKATLRVIPAEGGYLVDVQVRKELEDLDKPENSSAGGASNRHDGSLVRPTGMQGRYSVTLGWIPIGRDCSLEQRILANLQTRLNISGEVERLPAEPMVEEVQPKVKRIEQPKLEPIPETLPPPRKK